MFALRFSALNIVCLFFVTKVTWITNSHFDFQVRTKVSVHRTSPALGNATQKADAANQTKPQAVSPASQAQQMAGTK